MDRKSIAIVALCVILLLMWPRLMNHFYPPPPQPTNAVAIGTNQLSTTNVPEAQPYATPGVVGTNAAAFVVKSAVPEKELTITNDNARFTFTSRGGGLKQVELVRYPETVHTRRQRGMPTNDFATLGTPASPPVLAVMGEGPETLQGDGDFKLTPIPNGMRAEKTLTNGLAIVKDFQISSNYLMSASVRLENRSKEPVKLPSQEWVVGQSTPINAQDNGIRTLGVWYFDGNKVQMADISYFATNTSVLFVFPRTPKNEYRAPATNLVWVSAQNRFFALASMPTNEASSLIVRPINLPPPTQEDIDANPRTVVRAPRGLEASLEYPAEVLAPGAKVERHFNFFTGPKEYHLLAQIGDRFNNHLDWIMGFNGFFGWFAKALLTAMKWLHDGVSVPYGWAIVVITVLLKLIFWPLTQYSTKSMKRMQALQPEMKALQEKYKDDPQKLSQKQMEFWRKHKVNPLSGCLPMLLQLPLLWGFYRMLQSAIELRGAGFLWISDLSKPDTIFIIPGFDFPVNPMPLVMGATMLWQTHLTPPSPGMDPSQQKIMRYMPLMFLLFMYNFSSGLALYWTVQNLLSILQTKMIQSKPDTTTPAAAAPVPPQKKKK